MADRALHVLHIIGWIGSWDGPSVSIVNLTRGLARDPSVRVSVFTTDFRFRPGDSTARDLRVDGVQLSVFHTSPRRGMRQLSVRMCLALAREIGRVDLVHTHGLFSAPTAIANELALGLGTPLVITPSGALSRWARAQGSAVKGPYLRMVAQPCLESAAFVHCASEPEAEEVRRVVPSARVRTIGLGACLDDVDAASGQSTRPNDRSPYLLFIGRLHQGKRLDLLVKAFASLAVRYPDLQLAVAGPDEGARQPLEQEVAALQLGDRVAFIGGVSGTAKTRLLREAEALVLPSEHESFGIVVLEAAAAGTPVVVSTGVALQRDVREVGAGEVTSTRVEEIAEAISRVLERPRGAYAQGSARLVRRYNWDVAAAELLRAYREVLANRPTSSIG